MNNIVNKRLDFIDLAKGFGMLMVIYLHITINYPSEINIYAGSRWDSFVHSMFMPIFFILSGYFFSVKRPFKEWIHKKDETSIGSLCDILSFHLSYECNLGYFLRCSFEKWFFV